MSIVDKAISAVTPPESEEARREATQKAREVAAPGSWLAMALDHHDQIRAAFGACRSADTPAARLAAMKDLAVVLNGHALAEEIVLYPALAQAHKKGHAGQAYTEQTAAKMQMAELENIPPTEEDWLDKLGHIEGAVLHHMYEEEHSWFLELQDKAEDPARITARFKEEYDRYVRGGAH